MQFLGAVSVRCFCRLFLQEVSIRFYKNIPFYKICRPIWSCEKSSPIVADCVQLSGSGSFKFLNRMHLCGNSSPLDGTHHNKIGNEIGDHRNLITIWSLIKNLYRDRIGQKFLEVFRNYFKFWSSKQSTQTFDSKVQITMSKKAQFTKLNSGNRAGHNLWPTIWTVHRLKFEYQTFQSKNNWSVSLKGLDRIILVTRIVLLVSSDKLADSMANFRKF